MFSKLKNSYNYLQNKNADIQNLYDSFKKKASDFIFNNDYSNVAITTQNNEVGFNLILTEQEAIDFKSNITDYVLENNTMVQSGNTRQPLIITLKGKIAELYETKEKSIKYFDKIQQGLNKFTGISSNLSITAQQYFNDVNNLINKVENIVDKVDNAFNFVDTLFNQDGEFKNQLKAFQFLKTLWETGELFSINTFYGVFDNMLIQDLSFIQNESEYTSEISITLKQITFAKIQQNKKLNSEISATQKSEKVNNGINKSVLSKLISGKK